jgi:hypothetical protein
MVLSRVNHCSFHNSWLDFHEIIIDLQDDVICVWWHLYFLSTGICPNTVDTWLYFSTGHRMNAYCCERFDSIQYCAWAAFGHVFENKSADSIWTKVNSPYNSTLCQPPARASIVWRFGRMHIHCIYDFMSDLHPEVDPWSRCIYDVSAGFTS